MRSLLVLFVPSRVRLFSLLLLMLLLPGLALAQRHPLPASQLKTNNLPLSLARADIERDSLMRVPLRHRVQTHTRNAIRSRTRALRNLRERSAMRSKTDHVQQPAGKSSMSVAANEADSLALVALYESTGGASWTDQTNWLSGPVSTWYGIEVNPQGDVTIIDLEDNGLFGSLPPEITNLTELIALDLSDNFVLGLLPLDIGILAKLEVLDLGNNVISGEIPASIGEMPSLIFLVLWGNSISGPIPLSLANLPALEELWLFSNELSGEIPAEIGGMTSLRLLYLDQNQLTGTIPESLASLQNLTELFLDFNELTGEIPAILSQLPELQALFIGNNQLEGEIPLALGDLTGLLALSLSNNLLTGLIPESLSALSELVTLDLSGNYLEGTVPTSLEVLSELTHFYLANNQLTGTISPSIGLNLFNLKELDLSGNQLTGGVPESIGFLGNLAYLDLSGNQLSGPLPLFSLNEDLRWVYLNDNELSGPITLNFDAQELLIELDLSNNFFSGELPRSIGAHPILERLILGLNDFSGPVPETISALSALRVLDLWNNDFSGALPSGLDALASVLLIDIGSNNFTGAIPDHLGSLSSLIFLLLDENQFSGAVPASFMDLDMLSSLTLKNNQLTDLPDLSGLAALDTLDVGGNRLTFEDLEFNVDAAGGRINYAPQAPVQTHVDEVGTILRYAVDVGGTANVYQWFIGGQPIPDQTAPVLSIDIAMAGTADSVHAEITNRLATALDLTSIPVRNDARLARIEVVPDSVMLTTGDSLYFAYMGYDQFEAPRYFSGTWQARGGTIDSTGLYVAGDTSGVFMVTVSSLSGQVVGEATVEVDGVIGATAIESEAIPVDAFVLKPAYPNPVQEQAHIGFELPEPALLQLRMFDVLGREVAVLVDGALAAGRHEVTVDTAGWPAGIYFYTLQSGAFRSTQSLVKSHR